MSNHTPGPWSNDSDRIQAPFDQLGERGVTVATVSASWKDSAELAANARLIAAAPDLLALLQRFYAQTYGKTDLIPALDFEQARNAIAKAGGK